MVLHFGNGRGQALVMLMGAVGGLYAAARVAGLALDREEGANPGRRAIAQWIPIAGATIVAIWFGRSDIALSLIFSTSVGFLLLVLGITTWLAPLETLPSSRIVWPFLFPAALLVLMAGMSGHLSWWHALMMMALGGAILAVWVQEPTTSAPATSPRPALPLDYSSIIPAAGAARRRAVFIAIIIVGMTLVGSILAVRGTLAACSLQVGDNHVVFPGTFAATILSPLLIVPTLGAASNIAHRGEPGVAVTALIGSVFLNLCLLLPIAVLIWHFDPTQWNGHITQFFNIRWSRWHWLPFDLPAWQIETVSLVVIGFGLVPVAIGKWTIGRLESALLIFAYGGYIAMLVWFGVKQM